jgi:E3 ubiquitin-protein ligase SHPRH
MALVFHYEGIKKAKDVDQLTKELLSYDVVLTTYKVLSAEVHFTQPPPTRNMRHAKVYTPPRSPLVDIQWWRVCLDEAQMVESVVSKAASVARDVPRVNAWCVTGTPVRKDIDDLYGLLMFLRYEPFCNKGIWNNLVRYNHDAFRSVFGFIALRHTKDIVRDELYLPPQNRVVVTVPFSQVEEENYRQQFTQMCTDCGVDSVGAPLHEGWKQKDYAEKMRTWLTQLRQTCLHPEAGERNKKAFGSKTGPLRTVEEVLEVMIEQHMVQLRTDERALYQSIIKRGQVHEINGDIEKAMLAWQEALDLVKASVAECRKALAEEIKIAKESKEDPKAKAKATDEYEESDDEENQPEKKYQRVGAARNRLRTCLELEHACYFWLGTGYFQLREKEEKKGEKKKSKGKKKNDDQDPEGPDQEKIAEYEAKETEYYELAKKVRLEMMQETRKKALAHISEFQRKKERQAFVSVPDIIPPEEGAGGIESQTILDAIRELADVLNEQVVVYDEFREKLIGLLLEPLVDGEEEKELAGNEIEVSVEKQEESYAYMSVIRALLADRDQALTGRINSLIQRDMQTALARPSKVHNVLFRELMGLKDKANPLLAGNNKNLRLLMNDLKALIANLKQEEERGSQRARLERGTAELEFNKLQKMQAAQNKCIQDSFKYVYPQSDEDSTADLGQGRWSCFEMRPTRGWNSTVNCKLSPILYFLSTSRKRLASNHPTPRYSGRWHSKRPPFRKRSTIQNRAVDI